MSNIKLIEPSYEYVDSFKEMLQEMKNINNNVSVGSLLGRMNEDIVKILRNEEKGSGISKGWGPSTTLWLTDNEEVVGNINIRHRLTNNLKKIGGHVSYSIKPSERGKGYGSEMLRLSLTKVGEIIGSNTILIICNDDNIASVKIIEKNGGILQDKIEVDGKLIRRYHINV